MEEIQVGDIVVVRYWTGYYVVESIEQTEYGDYANIRRIATTQGKPRRDSTTSRMTFANITNLEQLNKQLLALVPNRS